MRSPRGRLQDSVNATLYIDCRSILLADHCSHFSYLLPHYVLLPPPSSCIYRGFRATFTIKSFIQFFTLQSLQKAIKKIIANGLIKALPKQRFKSFVNIIGMVNIK